MKRLSILTVVMAFILAGSIAAYPLTVPRYHVQSVGIGDDLEAVFKAFGPPQALQVVGGENGEGSIQVLYFHGQDSMLINVSDLPENKVTQIELNGNSWQTDAPVKIGDSVDKVVQKLGKPDKNEDLSTQKNWMIEQSRNDSVMRNLIEKNSGDTGSWFQSAGLYIEYDKNSQVVKSVKIYDPVSKLSININKL